MAKLTGIPPFTGTIGPVCIYQMYGRYFMRTRSSLTGQRVKKDPAFRKTMEYASLLSKASRIGSAVYAALPPTRKQHARYRKLTGEAMTWLKYQWTEAETLAWLMKQHVQEYPPIHLRRQRIAEVKDTFRRSQPGLYTRRKATHNRLVLLPGHRVCKAGKDPPVHTQDT